MNIQLIALFVSLSFNMLALFIIPDLLDKNGIRQIGVGKKKIKSIKKGWTFFGKSSLLPFFKTRKEASWVGQIT